jgi:hypothetical protein
MLSPGRGIGNVNVLQHAASRLRSAALVAYGAAADAAFVPAGQFVRRTAQPMRITRYADA